jgi:hypothetical protein
VSIDLLECSFWVSKIHPESTSHNAVEKAAIQGNESTAQNQPQYIFVQTSWKCPIGMLGLDKLTTFCRNVPILGFFNLAGLSGFSFNP